MCCDCGVVLSSYVRPRDSPWLTDVRPFHFFIQNVPSLAGADPGGGQHCLGHGQIFVY